MSYSTKEIWIPCDTVPEELGADGVESDVEPILSGGAGIPRGILYGVHGIISASGGNVEVRVYNNDAKERELFKTTLNFDGGVEQASDVGLSIPMFSTPQYTTEADATSAGDGFNITFYVKALA